ncbi:hypothetical protein Tco_1458488 [Tanacetum coccineum]
MMSDQLAEEKNTVKIKQTIISELEECLRKKDSENEHFKSKVVDFSTVQNLQVQVEKLKSVNESLNLSVEKLSKAQQSEIFHEVQSEFDSEIVHDIHDNSEKDVILSLQTQLKKTVELVVHFSDEKYCALKETKSLKVEIKSLQTENKVLKSKETKFINLEKVYGVKESELLEKIEQMKSQVSELLEKLKISDQEMKQQIILFEEDKRILITKFKFLKHDNSLEKMIEMIKKEYESKVSKISITSSTFESKNLKLVKEMGDKVKCFNDDKKVFENKISKIEKELAQRVDDFDDVKTELSKRTDKFETYFSNLEKENALSKS